MSVIIVPFIVFPFLGHLALYLPVLLFSNPFLSFSQSICCTNFVPPESCPPGETPTQNPTPSYHMLSGPGKMKRIRRLGSPMRRPRRRDQGGKDPPYEETSRDHRAGGEAQNKTREVFPIPTHTPSQYIFNAIQNTMNNNGKTTVKKNQKKKGVEANQNPNFQAKQPQRTV